MTLQDYLNDIGMQFFRAAPMTAFTAVVEWLFFLYVSFCVSRKRTNEHGEESVLKGMLTCTGVSFPASIAVLLLFPAVNIALHFQYYAIAMHCMCSVTIWTVYLCLAYGYAWNNAVYHSFLFCMLLELGKSLTRGGTPAYLLTRYCPSVTPANVSLFTYGLFLVYILLACVLVRRQTRTFSLPQVSPGQMAALLIPLLMYLLVRQYQSDAADELSINIWLFIDAIQLGVALCMLIVTAVISQMMEQQTQKNELLQRQLLMEKQGRQYLAQKEALEAVNHRYHDLKHYLTALEAAAGQHDSEAMGDFISRMRREIAPYETIQETGNQTMNILLAERIRQCQEKQIRFIPYVDGRRLACLGTVDLCTLFGNAMDNAVEASEKIADPQQREISLKITSQGELLLFQLTNYYALEPLRSDAERTLFQTNKADLASHGFGLRSMREIAQRYGGSMQCEAQDGLFTLTVLIPLD